MQCVVKQQKHSAKKNDKSWNNIGKSCFRCHNLTWMILNQPVRISTLLWGKFQLNLSIQEWTMSLFGGCGLARERSGFGVFPTQENWVHSTVVWSKYVWIMSTFENITLLHFGSEWLSCEAEIKHVYFYLFKSVLFFLYFECFKKCFVATANSGISHYASIDFLNTTLLYTINQLIN